jgi:hypothetical protein
MMISNCQGPSVNLLAMKMIAAAVSTAPKPLSVARAAQPVPNAAADSWASTVTLPRGTTLCSLIRSESPISIDPSSTPGATSVCCARFTDTARNCGTPLAIASTPVSAEQPAANALSRTTIPSASVAWIGPRSWPMV